jgi:hypothetical protein
MRLEPGNDDPPVSRVRGRLCLKAREDEFVPFGLAVAFPQGDAVEAQAVSQAEDAVVLGLQQFVVG